MTLGGHDLSRELRERLLQDVVALGITARMLREGVRGHDVDSRLTELLDRLTESLDDDVHHIYAVISELFETRIDRD